jgi:hypothetical protein
MNFKSIINYVTQRKILLVKLSSSFKSQNNTHTHRVKSSSLGLHGGHVGAHKKENLSRNISLSVQQNGGDIDDVTTSKFYSIEFLTAVIL